MVNGTTTGRSTENGTMSKTSWTYDGLVGEQSMSEFLANAAQSGAATVREAVETYINEIASDPSWGIGEDDIADAVRGVLADMQRGNGYQPWDSIEHMA